MTGIYEVFCGHKNFYFGKQPEPFPGAPDTVSIVKMYFEKNGLVTIYAPSDCIWKYYVNEF